MGDRSNIFIQQDRNAEGEWDGIGIYSHWGGTRLHESALRHLDAAKARQGDPAYFTRILVQNVMNDQFDPNSETGGGLWSQGPCDNEHPILVINAETGHHWFANEGDHRIDESKVRPA